MSTQVGSAHVAIFPTMVGFKKAVAQEFANAATGGKAKFSSGMKGAGENVGKQLGSELSSGLKDVKLDSSALDSLKEAANDAMKALNTARQAQQDSAAKTASAEARLEAAQNKVAATAAKTSQAEKALAKAISEHGEDSEQAQAAQLKLNEAVTAQKAAAAGVQQAEANLARAREKNVEATDRLVAAQKKAEHANEEYKKSLKMGEAIANDLAEAPVESAMEKLRGKVKNGLSKVLNAADSLGGMAAGAAAGGMFIAGFKSSMEKADVLTTLKAQLDLSKEDAQKAGDVASSLYANAWGESMSDVTQAVGSVMSSMKGMANASAGDLETITSQAMAMAGVFEVDVSEAVNTAGILMNSGLAGNAQEAMDLIAGAMQEVPAQVRGEILPVMDEYSKHFAQLGIDGDTAMQMVIQASEQGSIGMDKIGDAVKEFGIRATDMSSTTQGAYEALGLSTEEMTNKLLAGGDSAEGAMGQIVSALQGVKDPGEQAALALSLFGTPLEDLGTDQIPEFLNALNPATQATGDFAGKAQELADTAGSGPAASIEMLKRSFEGLMSTLTDRLVGPLTTVLEVLKEHPAILGVAAAAVGLFAAAWGAMKVASLIGQFSGFIGIIKEWQIATKIATGIQAAFNFVMNANPIGLVVTGLAALVAGVVYFFTQTETGKALWAGFMDALKSAWEWLTGVFAHAWEAISDAWNASMEWIKGVVSTVWEGIKTVISAVISWIAAFIQAYVNMWVTIIKTALNIIVTVVTTVWNGIKTVISTVLNVIKTVISTVWNGIKSVITTVLNTITGVMSSVWNGIKNTVSSAWNGIKNAVSGGVAGVFNLVKSLPGKILSALGNLGRLLFDSGKSLLQGLWNGISSAVGWVKSKISGALGSIRNLFPFSPAKEGPFSGRGWVLYSGLSIGEAMADGIAKSAPQAVRAASLMNALTQDALDTLHAPSVGASGTNLYSGASAQAAGGYVAGGVSYGTINIYNPVSEPSSTSLARELSKAAAGQSLLV